MIQFASDNWAGVHPAVLEALAEANSGAAAAYGDDPVTAESYRMFHALFGREFPVFYVFNGTGANVLSLTTLLRPHQAVLCAETAHINVDECGAPERLGGFKLITVKTDDGKLTPELLKPLLAAKGVVHHSQPGAISISQSTEYGTLYTPAEVKALADFAHAHDMYLHMDGARIANAAAVHPLKSITIDAGVDVLSFGGSKNGLMGAEAVLFFNEKPAEIFPYVRKQGMQLASKMRFVAAQFAAILKGDLWLENAVRANRMAARLADGLQKVPGVSLTQKQQANAVFATMPKQLIALLQERFSFYVWKEDTSEVRLMAGFQTTEADVDAFLSAASELSRC